MIYRLKYWLVIKIVRIIHFLFKKKVKIVDTYSDGQGIVEYQEHLKIFKILFIHHWYYGCDDYKIKKEVKE